MANADTIRVEVAYALPQQQRVIALTVPAGTTMIEAVRRSGITGECPEIDLDIMPLGIFGKVERSPATRALREGDRVEIYRPLVNDPKEARKARAAKAKATRD